MRELEPPDIHFVNAALGWLGLGNPREAHAELERVSAINQHAPEVLEVRWQICAAEKDWINALSAAREFVRRAPHRPDGWVNQSYSLHELKRTQEAREQLRLVARRFPDNCTIPYNLACYACQLGDLPEAKEWLRKAMELKGKEDIKRMALQDVDLQPLRAFIQTL